MSNFKKTEIFPEEYVNRLAILPDIDKSHSEYLALINEKSYPYYYPSLGLYEFNDIYLTNAGFIYDTEKKIIVYDDIYDLHFYETWLRNTAGKLSSLEIKQNDNVLYLDKKYLIITRGFYKVYGHWLLDILPSLWLFQNYSTELNNVEYIIHADTPDFAKKILLSLFGIKFHECVLIHPNSNDVYKIQNLIFPSLMRINYKISTKLLQFIETCIGQTSEKSEITKDYGKFLYISRKDVNKNSGRCLKNRSEVENVAISLGFEIRYPEIMTWEDQIKMFSSASIVIGEFGSLTLSSIFMPKNPVLLVLAHSKINLLQTIILNINSLKVEHIFLE
jgi:capsular polysaccharide biosynthesis protein